MRSILTLLILFSFSLAQAETNAPVETTPAEREVELPHFWSIITDLPTDLREFGKEVIAPENRGLVIGLLGMTAITVKTDYETWQALENKEVINESLHQFANYGVSMGDGFFQFGIVGGFLAAGTITGNHKAIRTAAQITEAILSTGIVVQLAKHIIGRESPFSSESRTGVWRVFPDQKEYLKDFQKYDAVPSGHLSTATTTYIVIVENYPDEKWIPYVGLPILGWISSGLVATSIHWWSDFPTAIAIGYSMAHIVTRPNRGELKTTQNSWKPMVYPSISSEGAPTLQAGWEF